MFVISHLPYIIIVDRYLLHYLNAASERHPLAGGRRGSRFGHPPTLAPPLLQDDVIVDPVIRHLDVNDAELQQRIQVEISNLYEFFKRLYDQDQMEIRWVFPS